jgi:hypothetical protein
MITVCLAGMHRSGTSLMASYLQHCGISMGQRLVQPGVGNPKGHFEDRDFVEFHKAVLRFNRTYMYAPCKSLAINDELRDRAREIVRSRATAGLNWGFKDPRSSLFLNFWKSMLPDARYLLVYRDPYLVIDSLFRRKGDWPLYFMFGWAASAWQRYNRDILRFFLENESLCALVNIGGFNRNPEQARMTVERRLVFSLGKPYSDVYSPKAITSEEGKHYGVYTKLDRLFYGKALDSLYAELENHALIDVTGRCLSGIRS